MSDSEDQITLEQNLQNFLTSRYAGKLLLRNEFQINSKLFSYLIHQKQIQPVKPIKKTSFTIQCHRCGNNKKYLFGVYPCHLCSEEHYYCRKCIEMGRVSECEPLYRWTGEQPTWLRHKSPCTWKGQLTSYQEKAANRIIQAIYHKEHELLIWAVCGSGKTEMLFPSITKALQLGKRICIATPRSDVVRELLPRLQSAFANIHIQGLYSGSRDNDGTAQLIISTTHQLLRYENTFDFMIIDEIDAFPFHADPSLPFAVNRAKKTNSTTVYLTATPRDEQKSLINQRKLAHQFIPVRYHNHPLPVPQMKMTFSLTKDLTNNEPPKSFISWMRKRKNINRQLLIFVPTISMAESLQETTAHTLLKEDLINSRDELIHVHSNDPSRSEKVEMFRKKKITVMITTTILERGVTFPSVDVAIFHAGHEVFDEAALVQIAGRAGRSADDPTGDVILFHDGKTRAMIKAIKSIQKMNERAGFD